MSSVNVIATLIVLLCALVCYAFLSQTIQRKREQRKRLLASLKSRSRTFKFMLNGFPTGFLTKELTLLVQRSLVDVSEQLNRLEPRDTVHKQDLAAATNALANTQRQPAKHNGKVTLQTPQQVKEVKMCLEELYRFIHNIEAKGKLAKSQADHYRKQVKQLVLQITIDSYMMQARAAKSDDKLKLAIHFLSTSLDLMIKNRAGFEDTIKVVRAEIAELRGTLEKTENKPISRQAAAHEEEIASEWAKYDEKESTWGKKKNVYD